jgi:DNA topoisomerase VI subunit A
MPLHWSHPIALLRIPLLFDSITRIPILMLVDGDPYGFEIASVYKFGSMKMKHEADDLTCPRGELLGIRVTDINR